MGPFMVPWGYAGPDDYDIRYAVALSCWTDVEALRTFTYSEAHLGALRTCKVDLNPPYDAASVNYQHGWKRS